MADMMDTLKGLLGDNADEKLSGIMNILNVGEAQTNEDAPKEEKEHSSDEANPIGITPDMLLAAQAIFSKMSQSGEDDRTRLLMSLKPYMRESRRDSIDSAVKMLNMAQMSQFFKEVM